MIYYTFFKLLTNYFSSFIKKNIVFSRLGFILLNSFIFVNGCGKGNKEKKGCPDEVNEILSQEILKRESEKFEPERYKYKGGAGFINNEKMAHYLVKKIIQGLEVLSFGFWDGKSKGTKDMISKLNEKKNSFNSVQNINKFF